MLSQLITLNVYALTKIIIVFIPWKGIILLTEMHSMNFQALLVPAYLIAQNAGVDGSIVVEKLLDSDWRNGYNAMTNEFEDLLKSGVVDPCRVSRCALQNAASVAGVVLLSQAAMVDKRRKPKPAVPLVPGISP